MADPANYSVWTEVRRGAIILIAGRITAATCGLIQVPIVLRHLGAEEFGIWITLSGVLWTLSGFDFGLGYALQNRLGIALAQGRSDDAVTLVRSGRRALTRIALLTTPPAMALVLWGDWLAWFNVTTMQLDSTVRSSAAIVLVTVLLSLPASLATRIAAAAQLTWLNGAWTAAVSVGALAVVAGSAKLGLGLPAFITAACMIALLPHLGIGLSLCRRFPWLRRPARAATISREIWRESALFFLPQLGASFINAFAPVLVAVFSGPVMAGSYGILQRLFGFVLQLHTLCLQPTWPAYTHATARQDHAGAHQLYRRSWFITALMIAALLIGLTPFTERLLELWLRGSVPPLTLSLIWAVALWHALQLSGLPSAMLLNGFGRPGVTAWSTLGCLILTLALSAWAGPRAGALGIVLALALPYALLHLPVVILGARAALKNMKNNSPPR